jgi:type VI secretion system protein ImpJ
MVQKPLQRVAWSEGSLVSPQHLQQQDLYHETLLDERIAGLTPYGWGVVSMDLDSQALAAGQVALRSFAGVLPFGTVLNLEPGAAESVPARAVASHFAPNQTELGVFLGVPRERPGTRLYAESETSRGQARYVREIRRVADHLDPSAEVSIEFGRRNVTLLFGTEPREDFECIKIAEVIRDANGKLDYSEPYVPPLLRLSGSSFLMNSTRRLLSLIVSRHRALAAERRQRDASTVEYTAHDVTRFLAMSAVGGAIPLLTHAAGTGQLSAHQLYVCLAQLAGQMMSFTVDADPSKLPPYIHEEPRNTFEPLFAQLTALLRAAVASQVITVSFERRPDGSHLGRLMDERLLKPGVRFFLDIQAALPEGRVYEEVPRAAKIASYGDFQRVVGAATQAVPATAAPRPPREIAVRHGHHYFALSVDNPFFRKVLEERGIAVYLPPTTFDPNSTVVELVAIPSE